MEWLRENWFWIVVAVGFVWMHLRMHGAHGHGGHGHSEQNADNGPDKHKMPRTRSEYDA